jgi:hypothetical protein
VGCRAAQLGGGLRPGGHNSVATVRGTEWLTEDRCDGTFAYVMRGVVSVRPAASITASPSPPATATFNAPSV